MTMSELITVVVPSCPSGFKTQAEADAFPSLQALVEATIAG